MMSATPAMEAYLIAAVQPVNNLAVGRLLVKSLLAYCDQQLPKGRKTSPANVNSFGSASSWLVQHAIADHKECKPEQSWAILHNAGSSLMLMITATLKESMCQDQEEVQRSVSIHSMKNEDSSRPDNSCSASSVGL